MTSTPSLNRSGRPRKASTVTPHALSTNGTPTLETTPSYTANGAGGVAGGAVTMPAPSFSSNGPMTTADCEHLAGQLLDGGVSARRKLEIASELRDSAESNREFAFYDKYLAIFIPTLITILSDEKTISFMKDSADQRYRHTLLSFLQRLPHTEPFRQHEIAIMELMVKLLRIENEENALLCLKVMIDGFRSHKV